MNELDAEFKGPLKEVVCKYVETYDHVTFAELGNHLGDRIKEPEPSASALEIPGNYVLWVGFTEEFYKVIQELMKEQAIHMVPASYMSYMIDGCMLRLPLAKSAKGYKKPHWLPVVFRPGPNPDKGKRNPLGHGLSRGANQ